MGSLSTVSSAKTLSYAQRKTIALRAMRRQQPISNIAETHQVSRKFVYTQQAKAYGRPQEYSHKLGIARQHEKLMRHLSESIDTLISWMEHDILNKAGPPPAERDELFDFVVDEFRKLEALHPHRIRDVCITLQNQKNLLLAFTDVLDKKFQSIAEQFSCSLNTVWKMCELQRCDYLGNSYAIRQIPLFDELGDQFDAAEDAVICALDSTERTSSMIENLNSD